MEYDEIRITTRREIGICREKIRELEQSIARQSTGERQSREALERWRKRLQAHLEIMGI